MKNSPALINAASSSLWVSWVRRLQAMWKKERRRLGQYWKAQNRRIISSILVVTFTITMTGLDNLVYAFDNDQYQTSDQMHAPSNPLADAQANQFLDTYSPVQATTGSGAPQASATSMNVIKAEYGDLLDTVSLQTIAERVENGMTFQAATESLLTDQQLVSGPGATHPDNVAAPIAGPDTTATTAPVTDPAAMADAVTMGQGPVSLTINLGQGTTAAVPTDTVELPAVAPGPGGSALPETMDQPVVTQAPDVVAPAGLPAGTQDATSNQPLVSTVTGSNAGDKSANLPDQNSVPGQQEPAGQSSGDVPRHEQQAANTMEQPADSMAAPEEKPEVESESDTLKDELAVLFGGAEEETVEGDTISVASLTRPGESGEESLDLNVTETPLQDGEEGVDPSALLPPSEMPDDVTESTEDAVATEASPVLAELAPDKPKGEKGPLQEQETLLTEEEPVQNTSDLRPEPDGPALVGPETGEQLDEPSVPAAPTDTLPEVTADAVDGPTGQYVQVKPELRTMPNVMVASANMMTLSASPQNGNGMTVNVSQWLGRGATLITGPAPNTVPPALVSTRAVHAAKTPATAEVGMMPEVMPQTAILELIGGSTFVFGNSQRQQDTTIQMPRPPTLAEVVRNISSAVTGEQAAVALPPQPQIEVMPTFSGWTGDRDSSAFPPTDYSTMYEHPDPPENDPGGGECAKFLGSKWGRLLLFAVMVCVTILTVGISSPLLPFILALQFVQTFIPMPKELSIALSILTVALTAWSSAIQQLINQAATTTVTVLVDGVETLVTEAIKTLPGLFATLSLPSVQIAIWTAVLTDVLVQVYIYLRPEAGIIEMALVNLLAGVLASGLAAEIVSGDNKNFLDGLLEAGKKALGLTDGSNWVKIATSPLVQVLAGVAVEALVMESMGGDSTRFEIGAAAGALTRGLLGFTGIALTGGFNGLSGMKIFSAFSGMVIAPVAAAYFGAFYNAHVAPRYEGFNSNQTRMLGNEVSKIFGLVLPGLDTTTGAVTWLYTNYEKAMEKWICGSPGTTADLPQDEEEKTEIEATTNNYTNNQVGIINVITPEIKGNNQTANGQPLLQSPSQVEVPTVANAIVVMESGDVEVEMPAALPSEIPAEDTSNRGTPQSTNNAHQIQLPPELPSKPQSNPTGGSTADNPAKSNLAGNAPAKVEQPDLAEDQINEQAMMDNLQGQTPNPDPNVGEKLDAGRLESQDNLPENIQTPREEIKIRDLDAEAAAGKKDEVKTGVRQQGDTPQVNGNGAEGNGEGGNEGEGGGDGQGGDGQGETANQNDNAGNHTPTQTLMTACAKGSLSPMLAQPVTKIQTQMLNSKLADNRENLLPILNDLRKQGMLPQGEFMLAVAMGENVRGEQVAQFHITTASGQELTGVSLTRGGETATLAAVMNENKVEMPANLYVNGKKLNDESFQIKLPKSVGDKAGLDKNGLGTMLKDIAKRLPTEAVADLPATNESASDKGHGDGKGKGMGGTGNSGNTGQNNGGADNQAADGNDNADAASDNTNANDNTANAANDGNAAGSPSASTGTPGTAVSTTFADLNGQQATLTANIPPTGKGSMLVQASNGRYYRMVYKDGKMVGMYGLTGKGFDASNMAASFTNADGEQVTVNAPIGSEGGSMIVRGSDGLEYKIQVSASGKVTVLGRPTIINEGLMQMSAVIPLGSDTAVTSNMLGEVSGLYQQDESAGQTTCIAAIQTATFNGQHMTALIPTDLSKTMSEADMDALVLAMNSNPDALANPEFKKYMESKYPRSKYPEMKPGSEAYNAKVKEFAAAMADKAAKIAGNSLAQAKTEAQRQAASTALALAQVAQLQAGIDPSLVGAMTAAIMKNAQNGTPAGMLAVAKALLAVDQDKALALADHAASLLATLTTPEARLEAQLAILQIWKAAGQESTEKYRQMFADTMKKVTEQLGAAAPSAKAFAQALVLNALAGQTGANLQMQSMYAPLSQAISSAMAKISASNPQVEIPGVGVLTRVESEPGSDKNVLYILEQTVGQTKYSMQLTPGLVDQPRWMVGKLTIADAKGTSKVWEYNGKSFVNTQSRVSMQVMIDGKVCVRDVQMMIASTGGERHGVFKEAGVLYLVTVDVRTGATTCMPSTSMLTKALDVVAGDQPTLMEMDGQIVTPDGRIVQPTSLDQLQAVLEKAGLTPEQARAQMKALGLQGQTLWVSGTTVFVGSKEELLAKDYQVAGVNTFDGGQQMLYLADVKGGKLHRAQLSDGRVILFERGNPRNFQLVRTSPDGSRTFTAYYRDGKLQGARLYLKDFDVCMEFDASLKLTKKSFNSMNRSQFFTPTSDGFVLRRGAKEEYYTADGQQVMKTQGGEGETPSGLSSLGDSTLTTVRQSLTFKIARFGNPEGVAVTVDNSRTYQTGIQIGADGRVTLTVTENNCLGQFAGYQHEYSLTANNGWTLTGYRANRQDPETGLMVTMTRSPIPGSQWSGSREGKVYAQLANGTMVQTGWQELQAVMLLDAQGRETGQYARIMMSRGMTPGAAWTGNLDGAVYTMTSEGMARLTATQSYQTVTAIKDGESRRERLMVTQDLSHGNTPASASTLRGDTYVEETRPEGTVFVCQRIAEDHYVELPGSGLAVLRTRSAAVEGSSFEFTTESGDGWVAFGSPEKFAQYKLEWEADHPGASFDKLFKTMELEGQVHVNVTAAAETYIQLPLTGERVLMTWNPLDPNPKLEFTTRAGDHYVQVPEDYTGEKSHVNGAWFRLTERAAADYILRPNGQWLLPSQDATTADAPWRFTTSTGDVFTVTTLPAPKGRYSETIDGVTYLQTRQAWTRYEVASSGERVLPTCDLTRGNSPYEFTTRAGDTYSMRTGNQYPGRTETFQGQTFGMVGVSAGIQAKMPGGGEGVTLTYDLTSTDPNRARFTTADQVTYEEVPKDYQPAPGEGAPIMVAGKLFRKAGDTYGRWVAASTGEWVRPPRDLSKGEGNWSVTLANGETYETGRGSSFTGATITVDNQTYGLVARSAPAYSRLSDGQFVLPTEDLRVYREGNKMRFTTIDHAAWEEVKADYPDAVQVGDRWYVNTDVAVTGRPVTLPGTGQTVMIMKSTLYDEAMERFTDLYGNSWQEVGSDFAGEKVQIGDKWFGMLTQVDRVYQVTGTGERVLRTLDLTIPNAKWQFVDWNGTTFEEAGKDFAGARRTTVNGKQYGGVRETYSSYVVIKGEIVLPFRDAVKSGAFWSMTTLRGETFQQVGKDFEGTEPAFTVPDLGAVAKIRETSRAMLTLATGEKVFLTRDAVKGNAKWSFTTLKGQTWESDQGADFKGRTLIRSNMRFGLMRESYHTYVTLASGEKVLPTREAVNRNGNWEFTTMNGETYTQVGSNFRGEKMTAAKMLFGKTRVTDTAYTVLASGERVLRSRDAKLNASWEYTTVTGKSFHEAGAGFLADFKATHGYDFSGTIVKEAGTHYALMRSSARSFTTLPGGEKVLFNKDMTKPGAGWEFTTANGESFKQTGEGFRESFRERNGYSFPGKTLAAGGLGFAQVRATDSEYITLGSGERVLLGHDTTKAGAPSEYTDANGDSYKEVGSDFREAFQRESGYAFEGHIEAGGKKMFASMRIADSGYTVLPSGERVLMYRDATKKGAPKEFTTLAGDTYKQVGKDFKGKVSVDAGGAHFGRVREAASAWIVRNGEFVLPTRDTAKPGEAYWEISSAMDGSAWREQNRGQGDYILESIADAKYTVTAGQSVLMTRSAQAGSPWGFTLLSGNYYEQDLVSVPKEKKFKDEPVFLLKRQAAQRYEQGATGEMVLRTRTIEKNGNHGTWEYTTLDGRTFTQRVADGQGPAEARKFQGQYDQTGEQSYMDRRLADHDGKPDGRTATLFMTKGVNGNGSSQWTGSLGPDTFTVALGMAVNTGRQKFMVWTDGNGLQHIVAASLDLNGDHDKGGYSFTYDRVSYKETRLGSNRFEKDGDQEYRTVELRGENNHPTGRYATILMSKGKGWMDRWSGVIDGRQYTETEDGVAKDSGVYERYIQVIQLNNGGSVVATVSQVGVHATVTIRGLAHDMGEGVTMANLDGNDITLVDSRGVIKTVDPNTGIESTSQEQRNINIILASVSRVGDSWNRWQRAIHQGSGFWENLGHVFSIVGNGLLAAVDIILSPITAEQSFMADACRAQGDAVGYTIHKFIATNLTMIVMLVLTPICPAAGGALMLASFAAELSNGIREAGRSLAYGFVLQPIEGIIKGCKELYLSYRDDRSAFAKADAVNEVLTAGVGIAFMLVQAKQSVKTGIKIYKAAVNLVHLIKMIFSEAGKTEKAKLGDALKAAIGEVIHSGLSVKNMVGAIRALLGTNGKPSAIAKVLKQFDVKPAVKPGRAGGSAKLKGPAAEGKPGAAAGRPDTTPALGANGKPGVKAAAAAGGEAGAFGPRTGLIVKLYQSMFKSFNGARTVGGMLVRGLLMEIPIKMLGEALALSKNSADVAKFLGQQPPTLAAKLFASMAKTTAKMDVRGKNLTTSLSSVEKLLGEAKQPGIVQKACELLAKDGEAIPSLFTNSQVPDGLLSQIMEAGLNSAQPQAFVKVLGANAGAMAKAASLAAAAEKGNAFAKLANTARGLYAGGSMRAMEMIARAGSKDAAVMDKLLQMSAGKSEAARQMKGTLDKMAAKEPALQRLMDDAQVRSDNNRIQEKVCDGLSKIPKDAAGKFAEKIKSLDAEQRTQLGEAMRSGKLDAQTQARVMESLKTAFSQDPAKAMAFLDAFTPKAFEMAIQGLKLGETMRTMAPENLEAMLKAVSEQARPENLQKVRDLCEGVLRQNDTVPKAGEASESAGAGGADGTGEGGNNGEADENKGKKENKETKTDPKTEKQTTTPQETIQPQPGVPKPVPGTSQNLKPGVTELPGKGSAVPEPAMMKQGAGSSPATHGSPQRPALKTPLSEPAKSKLAEFMSASEARAGQTTPMEVRKPTARGREMFETAKETRSRVVGSVVSKLAVLKTVKDAAASLANKALDKAPGLRELQLKTAESRVQGVKTGSRVAAFMEWAVAKTSLPTLSFEGVGEMSLAGAGGLGAGTMSVPVVKAGLKPLATTGVGRTMTQALQYWGARKSLAQMRKVSLMQAKTNAIAGRLNQGSRGVEARQVASTIRPGQPLSSQVRKILGEKAKTLDQKRAAVNEKLAKYQEAAESGSAAELYKAGRELVQAEKEMATQQTELQGAVGEELASLQTTRLAECQARRQDLPRLEAKRESLKSGAGDARASRQVEKQIRQSHAAEEALMEVVQLSGSHAQVAESFLKSGDMEMSARVLEAASPAGQVEILSTAKAQGKLAALCNQLPTENLQAIASTLGPDSVLEVFQGQIEAGKIALERADQLSAGLPAKEQKLQSLEKQAQETFQEALLAETQGDQALAATKLEAAAAAEKSAAELKKEIQADQTAIKAHHAEAQKQLAAVGTALSSHPQLVGDGPSQGLMAEKAYQEALKASDAKGVKEARELHSKHIVSPESMGLIKEFREFWRTDAKGKGFAEALESFNNANGRTQKLTAESLGLKGTLTESALERCMTQKQWKTQAELLRAEIKVAVLETRVAQAQAAGNLAEVRALSRDLKSARADFNMKRLGVAEVKNAIPQLKFDVSEAIRFMPEGPRKEELKSLLEKVNDVSDRIAAACERNAGVKPGKMDRSVVELAKQRTELIKQIRQEPGFSEAMLRSLHLENVTDYFSGDIAYNGRMMSRTDAYGQAIIECLTELRQTQAVAELAGSPIAAADLKATLMEKLAEAAPEIPKDRIGSLVDTLAKADEPLTPKSIAAAVEKCLAQDGADVRGKVQKLLESKLGVADRLAQKIPGLSARQAGQVLETLANMATLEPLTLEAVGRAVSRELPELNAEAAESLVAKIKEEFQVKEKMSTALTEENIAALRPEVAKFLQQKFPEMNAQSLRIMTEVVLRYQGDVNYRNFTIEETSALSFVFRQTELHYLNLELHLKSPAVKLIIGEALQLAMGGGKSCSPLTLKIARQLFMEAHPGMKPPAVAYLTASPALVNQILKEASFKQMEAAKELVKLTKDNAHDVIQNGFEDGKVYVFDCETLKHIVLEMRSSGMADAEIATLLKSKLGTVAWDEFHNAFHTTDTIIGASGIFPHLSTSTQAQLMRMSLHHVESFAAVRDWFLAQVKDPVTGQIRKDKFVNMFENIESAPGQEVRNQVQFTREVCEAIRLETGLDFTKSADAMVLQKMAQVLSTKNGREWTGSITAEGASHYGTAEGGVGKPNTIFGDQLQAAFTTAEIYLDGKGLHAADVKAKGFMTENAKFLESVSEALVHTTTERVTMMEAMNLIGPENIVGFSGTFEGMTASLEAWGKKLNRINAEPPVSLFRVLKNEAYFQVKVGEDIVMLRTTMDATGQRKITLEWANEAVDSQGFFVDFAIDLIKQTFKDEVAMGKVVERAVKQQIFTHNDNGALVETYKAMQEALKAQGFETSAVEISAASVESFVKSNQADLAAKGIKIEYKDGALTEASAKAVIREMLVHPGEGIQLVNIDGMSPELHSLALGVLEDLIKTPTGYKQERMIFSPKVGEGLNTVSIPAKLRAMEEMGAAIHQMDMRPLDVFRQTMKRVNVTSENAAGEVTFKRARGMSGLSLDFNDINNITGSERAMLADFASRLRTVAKMDATGSRGRLELHEKQFVLTPEGEITTYRGSDRTKYIADLMMEFNDILVGEGGKHPGTGKEQPVGIAKRILNEVDAQKANASYETQAGLKTEETVQVAVEKASAEYMPKLARTVEQRLPQILRKYVGVTDLMGQAGRSTFLNHTGFQGNLFRDPMRSGSITRRLPFIGMALNRWDQIQTAVQNAGSKIQLINAYAAKWQSEMGDGFETAMTQKFGADWKFYQKLGEFSDPQKISKNPLQYNPITLWRTISRQAGQARAQYVQAMEGVAQVSAAMSRFQPGQEIRFRGEVIANREQANAFIRQNLAVAKSLAMQYRLPVSTQAAQFQAQPERHTADNPLLRQAAFREAVKAQVWYERVFVSPGQRVWSRLDQKMSEWRIPITPIMKVAGMVAVAIAAIPVAMAMVPGVSIAWWAVAAPVVAGLAGSFMRPQAGPSWLQSLTRADRGKGMLVAGGLVTAVAWLVNHAAGVQSFAAVASTLFVKGMKAIPQIFRDYKAMKDGKYFNPDVVVVRAVTAEPAVAEAAEAGAGLVEALKGKNGEEVAVGLQEILGNLGVDFGVQGDFRSYSGFARTVAALFDLIPAFQVPENAKSVVPKIWGKLRAGKVRILDQGIDAIELGELGSTARHKNAVRVGRQDLAFLNESFHVQIVRQGIKAAIPVLFTDLEGNHWTHRLSQHPLFKRAGSNALVEFFEQYLMNGKELRLAMREDAELRDAYNALKAKLAGKEFSDEDLADLAAARLELENQAAIAMQGLAAAIREAKTVEEKAALQVQFDSTFGVTWEYYLETQRPPLGQRLLEWFWSARPLGRSNTPVKDVKAIGWQLAGLGVAGLLAAFVFAAVAAVPAAVIAGLALMLGLWGAGLIMEAGKIGFNLNPSAAVTEQMLGTNFKFGATLGSMERMASRISRQNQADRADSMVVFQKQFGISYSQFSLLQQKLRALDPSHLIRDPEFGRAVGRLRIPGMANAVSEAARNRAVRMVLDRLLTVGRSEIPDAMKVQLIDDAASMLRFLQVDVRITPAPFQTGLRVTVTPEAVPSTFVPDQSMRRLINNLDKVGIEFKRWGEPVKRSPKLKLAGSAA